MSSGWLKNGLDSPSAIMWRRPAQPVTRSVSSAIGTRQRRVRVAYPANGGQYRDRTAPWRCCGGARPVWSAVATLGLPRLQPWACHRAVPAWLPHPARPQQPPPSAGFRWSTNERWRIDHRRTVACPRALLWLARIPPPCHVVRSHVVSTTPSAGPNDAAHTNRLYANWRASCAQPSGEKPRDLAWVPHGHTTESMDELLAGSSERGPRQACGTYERGTELRAFNGSKVMGGARIGVDFTGPGQLAQAAIHRARRETPSRGK